MPRLLPPTSKQPPRHPRGASTTEYLMVVGFIVIPLALLVPVIIHMITLYLGRIALVMRMPLG